MVAPGTQHEEAPMSTWPGAIGAITLVQEDLDAARRFYTEVFGLPVEFEDDVSCVVRFGATMVNLLSIGAAPELLDPAPVADRGPGARAVMTLDVDDVDARCATLAALGVVLLSGPMDRPWGIRTASFRDPGGHVWELAAPIDRG